MKKRFFIIIPSYKLPYIHTTTEVSEREILDNLENYLWHYYVLHISI